MIDTTEAWERVIAAIVANSSCVQCAALSEPRAFQDYFVKTLDNASYHAGRKVLPFGVGEEGAFMLGALAVGGYAFMEVGVHESIWIGDPQDLGGEVAVWGLDPLRLAENCALAEAHGLRVMATFDMSTNEGVYL